MLLLLSLFFFIGPWSLGSLNGFNSKADVVVVVVAVVVGPWSLGSLNGFNSKADVVVVAGPRSWGVSMDCR